MFRDIAVAISVSVLLSLLVSVTVIPALANRLLTGEIKTSANWFRLPLIDDFGAWFVRPLSAAHISYFAGAYKKMELWSMVRRTNRIMTTRHRSICGKKLAIFQNRSN